MPGMRLDNPPPPPGDVSAQMGAMLQQKFAQNGQQPGQEGAPPGNLQSISDANPRGALMVKVNAIEKVMREIAQQHEAMAPYVERSLGILKQGMQEVLSQGNQQSTAEPQSGMGPNSAPGGGQKPLEGHSDSSFVG